MIGEYCQGGIISVEIDDNNVTLIGREWDYSKPLPQDNARKWIHQSYNIHTDPLEWLTMGWLEEITTYYHADMIMKWIKKQIK